uniref:Thy-1 membrane glycoprotein n=1 Tax=Denticeps clupeoides TaxID=299321 RepID=A0AAY4BLV8_9TELE
RKYLYSVLFTVSVSPLLSDKITVCQEEDNDLRVDCQLEPNPHPLRIEYEFSMSTGSKETIINTNVSGITADVQFRQNKAYAEQLDQYLIRLTVKDFTLSENTTFMCKISADVESVFVEHGKSNSYKIPSLLCRLQSEAYKPNSNEVGVLCKM